MSKNSDLLLFAQLRKLVKITWLQDTDVKYVTIMRALGWDRRKLHFSFRFETLKPLIVCTPNSLACCKYVVAFSELGKENDGVKVSLDLEVGELGEK